MDYPCGVIQDLMPSYLEGTCSPEAEAAVKDHLAHCENCIQKFQKLQEENSQYRYDIDQLEKWGSFWLLKDALCWIRQNFRTIVKYTAVITAICVICVTGYYAWNGLTQIDCVQVDTNDFQVKQVLQLSDGDIFCSYDVRYHSTFTHHYVIEENTVYFPAKRPVLDRKYSNFGEHGGCWIMDPDSVWDESLQQYIEIEAIYLGNPEDCILVWQRGMKLPMASSEEEARIETADWTIF